MTTPPLLSYACPVDWSKMSGSERVRFCDACGRHVRNLSLLSDSERESLIARAGKERVCGAYWVRLNGGMVTPASPLSPRERSSVRQFGAALLSAGALAVASGCVSSPKQVEPPPVAVAPAESEVAAGEEEVVLLLGFICEPPPPPAKIHGAKGRKS